MNGIKKIWTKAEKTGKAETKTARVYEFESGNKVEISTNKDGSVKWFDDSKLKKR